MGVRCIDKNYKFFVYNGVPLYYILFQPCQQCTFETRVALF